MIKCLSLPCMTESQAECFSANTIPTASQWDFLLFPQAVMTHTWAQNIWDPAQIKYLWIVLPQSLLKEKCRETSLPLSFLLHYFGYYIAIENFYRGTNRIFLQSDNRGFLHGYWFTFSNFLTGIEPIWQLITSCWEFMKQLLPHEGEIIKWVKAAKCFFEEEKTIPAPLVPKMEGLKLSALEQQTPLKPIKCHVNQGPIKSSKKVKVHKPGEDDE